MEKNKKTFKGRKRLKFRHIYALIMLGVTAYFAWHVLDLLVLTPRQQIGQAVHGYRMNELEPLADYWLREAEEFGATLDVVDYVEITWLGGPVVYISVRIFEGTERRPGERAAGEILNYLNNISGGVATQYNLQVVLSHGLIAQRDEDGIIIDGALLDNQAAVIEHVHQFNHDFAVRTLRHAERHPSDENVARAAGNINRFLRASIVETVGEDGLIELQNRLDAIEITEFDYDGDGEADEYVPRYQGVFQVRRSRISTFQRWGAWSNEQNRIIWRP